MNRNKNKEDLEEKEILEKCLALLNDMKWIRTGNWSTKEIESLNNVIFIILYLRILILYSRIVIIQL